MSNSTISNKLVQAGTLESNDIYITVETKPAEYGVEIELNSAVFAQYGDDIKQTIKEMVAQSGIRSGLHIVANDKGALTCTIEARMKTVLARLGGNQ